MLELTATLVAPRGPDDGFDERTWLRRHGVHVVVRGRDWRVVGHRGGLSGFADRVRGSIDTAIASGTSGERRAVLLGIVLGEDEGLTDALRDDFRASGLYHLLAVSGSNVALVAGGVLLLAWLLGIPRLIGEVGALAAIGAYVMAVGAQPSVVRAGVAGALTSLAWICARERDRWWFLLVGAFVLLVWSPYNLLDAGFQLSFAAVAAIFVLVPPLMRLLEGYPLPGVVAGVVAVSTACGVVTAPILLVQFGSVPTYSVFSNALAAPVVAPLLGLGLLSAVVYPVLPDVATLVASLDGWLAAYLSACARLVAGLPYARIGALPMLGVVAAVVFAWVRATSVRRRAEAGIALAVVALAGFAGWHMLPHASSPPPPNGLRITFLDVGQGDGALIQVPEGAVLVDEGPPEAHVAAQLRRLGVRALSVVVLTHPERDHVGGAADVLARDRRRRSSSIRGSRRPARTSARPSWPPARNTTASSRHGPGWRSGSAGCGSGCCGRTGPDCRATTRTTMRPSCSSRTGRPTRSSPRTRSRTSYYPSGFPRSRSSRSPTTARPTPACRSCSRICGRASP